MVRNGIYFDIAPVCSGLTYREARVDSKPPDLIRFNITVIIIYHKKEDGPVSGLQHSAPKTLSVLPFLRSLPPPAVT